MGLSKSYVQNYNGEKLLQDKILNNEVAKLMTVKVFKKKNCKIKYHIQINSNSNL